MARGGDGGHPEPSDGDGGLVLEDLVVGGEHGGVGLSYRDVDPRVAHRLDRLDVVPVPVGLDDLAHMQVPTQLQQKVVLVGRVDQERVAGLPAADDVDVVLHGSDHYAVHLYRGVLVVDDGFGHGYHLLAAERSGVGPFGHHRIGSGRQTEHVSLVGVRAVDARSGHGHTMSPVGTALDGEPDELRLQRGARRAPQVGAPIPRRQVPRDRGPSPHGDGRGLRPRGLDADGRAARPAVTDHP